MKSKILYQLDAILNPKSVAIVGASTDPMKMSNWITMNMLKSNFKGQVHLVNPKMEKINNIQTYANVFDIPSSIDLAAIMVPAASVADVLKECIDKGAKGAIIFSAGYREVGEEGREKETEILEIAHKSGLRIIGPNCMGVYSATSNLNLTALSVRRGEVALVSQSGGYGLEIAATAMFEGIAFSNIISTGDKADLKDNDYLEYLYQDPHTKAIIFYLESLEKGRDFYDIAKKVTKKKPIFAIKIGRSTVGRAAAQSHTGALTGEEEVYDAAFRQAGIFRAKDIEELFDYVKAYMFQPLPRGNRVGILVGSGGIGVAAADKCAELGLQVPPLSEMNQAILREFLPDFASIKNPVDLTGSGANLLFGNWGEIRDIFTDPNIDSWFFSFPGSGFSSIEEIVKSYEPLMTGLEEMTPSEVFGRSNAPFVAAGNIRDTTIKPLLEKLLGLLFYPTPERAIRALAMLNAYREFLEKEESFEEHAEFEIDDYTSKDIFTNAIKNNRSSLTEIESKQLLQAYGIPTIKTYLAKTQEEAVKYAENIGYPVVLKIVSPEIRHKSDARCVKLNLENKNQVVSAYHDILRNAQSFNPTASVLGVSVQQMATQGIEVIVGMKKDSQFGPVIMFGLGGVLVELLRDIAIRLIPINRGEAMRMMQEIRLHQLLNGYRQYEPVDKSALASILLKVSKLVEDYPSIKEIDLNPIFSYSNGAIVVDARVILEF